MLSLLRISLDFLEVTFFSFVHTFLPARLTPCSVSKIYRIATRSNTMLYSTLFLQVIYNNLCPQWNEFFRVSVCHYAKKLHFRVKDQDELGTDQVGEVCIPVEELLKKPKLTINGK